MFAPFSAQAVPARGNVWTFTQPDGTKFQAVLIGDEFHAYHKTTDGSIVVQDSATGYWYHAAPKADGSLVPTGTPVGKTAVDTTQLNAELAPWLKAVEKAVAEKADRVLRSSSGKKIPPVGSQKAVMLLANFSDTAITHTQPTFTSLMNTANYNSNGAQGSVRDYYLEASYGTLTIQTDVYGQLRKL